MAANISLSDRIGNKSILVSSEGSGGGRGDLMCTYKVAQLLADQGGVPESQIICQMREGDINQFPIEGRKFVIQSFAKEIPTTNIALHILAPGDVPSYKAPAPILLLREYNFPPQNFLSERYAFIREHALGLNEERQEGFQGIFVDRELFQWSQTEEAKDPEKRIFQLELLSESRLAEILGQDVTSKRVALEEFQRENVLFFGYASKQETREKFVEAIISYSATHHPGKKVTVLFAGANHRNQPSTDAKVISLDLTPTEMRTLFRGAQRECLVTGDQTISEAISAGMLPIYERLDYKSDLAEALEANFGLMAYKSYRNMTAILEHLHADKDQIDHTSRKICLEQDATTNVLHLATEALESQREVPRDLCDQVVTAESLPLDQLACITTDQICQLDISSRTLAIKGFPQWKFQSSMIDLTHYLIRKVKA